MSKQWPEMAEFMGAAYLRYSFTKGTEQEVAFLAGVLGLEAGQRVLDVGCGPGRHAHALARRGIEVVGVDLSPRFVELARAGAPPGATFECLDARRLPYESEFDAKVEERYDGAVGVSTDDPALAWARGTAVYRISWPEAEVHTEAHLDLRSDADAYHVVIDVVAEEIGSEVETAGIRHERRFERTIPRRLA